MKRRSISLVIRETQIRTKWKVQMKNISKVPFHPRGLARVGDCSTSQNGAIGVMGFISWMLKQGRVLLESLRYRWENVGVHGR